MSEKNFYFYDRNLNRCPEHKAIYKVSSVKVYSFSKLSYNTFLKKANGKWINIDENFNEIKKFYIARAQYFLTKNTKMAEKFTNENILLISLPYVIFDKHCQEASAEIPKYTYIPRWGIKCNQGIDYDFYISINNLQKFKESWESYFGKGQFKLYITKIEDFKNILDKSQKALEYSKKKIKESKDLLKDIQNFSENSVKKIQENTNEINKISDFELKYRRLLNDLANEPKDAVKIATAKSYYQKVKYNQEQIQKYKEEINEILKKAIELLSVKITNESTFQKIQNEQKENKNQDKKQDIIQTLISLNSKYMQFIHKLAERNKTTRNTIRSVLQYFEIPLLEETKRLLEEDE